MRFLLFRSYGDPDERPTKSVVPSKFTSWNEMSHLPSRFLSWITTSASPSELRSIRNSIASDFLSGTNKELSTLPSQFKSKFVSVVLFALSRPSLSRRSSQDGRGFVRVNGGFLDFKNALTSSTEIAKFRFSASAALKEFTPSNLPESSNSGPPELPAFVGVCV
jgi:hypothetical protein